MPRHPRSFARPRRNRGALAQGRQQPAAAAQRRRLSPGARRPLRGIRLDPARHDSSPPERPRAPSTAVSVPPLTSDKTRFRAGQAAEDPCAGAERACPRRDQLRRVGCVGRQQRGQLVRRRSRGADAHGSGGVRRHARRHLGASTSSRPQSAPTRVLLARTSRELLRGLYAGDGSLPAAKGVAFVVGDGPGRNRPDRVPGAHGELAPGRGVLGRDLPVRQRLVGRGVRRRACVGRPGRIGHASAGTRSTTTCSTGSCWHAPARRRSRRRGRSSSPPRRRSPTRRGNGLPPSGGRPSRWIR